MCSQSQLRFRQQANRINRRQQWPKAISKQSDTLAPSRNNCKPTQQEISDDQSEFHWQAPRLTEARNENDPQQTSQPGMLVKLRQCMEWIWSVLRLQPTARERSIKVTPTISAQTTWQAINNARRGAARNAHCYHLMTQPSTAGKQTFLSSERELWPACYLTFRTGMPNI